MWVYLLIVFLYINCQIGKSVENARIRTKSTGTPDESGPIQLSFMSVIHERFHLFCKAKLRSCSSHGECLLDKCICDPGWTGEYCSVPSDTPLEECVPIFCEPVECTEESKDICDKTIRCYDDCSDRCFLHPDYGVSYVTYERWQTAQMAELRLWVQNINGSTDRNDWHLASFNYYRPLVTAFQAENNQASPIHLGHVLEMASGPYTQLKTILSATNATVSSITLLEPLILQYQQNVSGCTYKDNTLNGRRVNYLVGRIEDFQAAEVYDTVIMINGIEHCQDAISVLYNLYMSIKPGGYVIWSESAFDSYDGLPYSVYNDVLDFVFHPIRLKSDFFKWFFGTHFENIFFVEYPNHTSEASYKEFYFIGRKPMIDSAFDFVTTEMKWSSARSQSSPQVDQNPAKDGFDSQAKSEL